MWFRVPSAVMAGLLAIFLVMLSLPAGAQKASRSKTQARGVPVATPAVAPFTLTDPTVDAASSTRATYPAGDPDGAPAVVYHGGRPGPVIAYLFHGFTSVDAFYAETESIFGVLPLDAMQGTVLVLSLPRRPDCSPECAPDTSSAWARLSGGLVDSTRFLIELHQESARPADFISHAFAYLPTENARLATYVKALASAALIGHVVEIGENELDAEKIEHLAARSVAAGRPALSIEGPLLEGNASGPAVQLRKGLVNVLRHLKMISGGVGWQNASKRMKADQLPDEFFGRRQ